MTTLVCLAAAILLGWIAVNIGAFAVLWWNSRRAGQ